MDVVDKILDFLWKCVTVYIGYAGIVLLIGIVVLIWILKHE